LSKEKIDAKVIKELVKESEDLEYGKIEIIFQKGRVIDLVKEKRKRLI